MDTKKAGKIGKKLLLLFGWAGGAVLFIITMSAAVEKQKEVRCNSISVSIDHSQGNFFVDEGDVRRSIHSFSGDSLEGRSMGTIDFASLEHAIEKNPYVANAEIFTNISGRVNVEVVQREPLIRVINNNRVSFYIDKNGGKMPLSSKFTARIAVATGYIPVDNGETKNDSSLVNDLYKLASFIDRNEFWKAQFEQIDVTREGEFELIPKLGNQVIQIGKVDDQLEDKFRKLMIFYKEVLKNVDANEYKTINVKFRDQIVCSRI